MLEDFFFKLKNFFQDPSVLELCVNGARSMTLFCKGGFFLKESPFLDELTLIRLCQNFALSQGQRLDAYCPSAGAQVENFRWHCLIPPASPSGALFSLRRHAFDEIALDSFQVSTGNASLLKTVFQDPKNHILFCGETGSGKTSLLASFLKHYAYDQRVILIEEYAELPVESPHWVRLLSRKPDIEEKGALRLSFLIEESLRLRPDRLVLGEIRTLDSLVFFESLLFGHYGSLATIHGSQKAGIRKRINALLAMRKGSQKFFWSSFEDIDSLWLVFLERGSPPSIVGVQRGF